MKKWTILTLFCGVCLAFTTVLHEGEKEEPVAIPASPQRVGQKDKGYQYLTTGDYIKSGIPYNYFLLGFGKSVSNLLKRDSPNNLISQEYTAVKAPNGETVVAPNCLQCHAQVFEDKLYIGMGNSMIDFTDRQKLNARNATMAEAILQGLEMPLGERKERWTAMMKVLERNDITAWRESFVRALTATARGW